MAQGVMATALVDDFTTTLGYAWPISFKGQGIGSCQAKNNGAKQMSPSNINSFVGDLVQMAQAMEQLPKVEAELSQTREQLDRTQQDVQDRELAIVNYKREIEELHAKVRSLEVERDDASFRVLEAEDKEHAALVLARDAKAYVEGVIEKLDPPKPEPVKEPEPVSEPQAPTTPAEGQSDVSPTTEHSLNIGEHAGTTQGSPSVPNAVTSISEVPAGQSVENPSASNPAGNGSHIGDATTMIAEKQSDAAAFPTEPTHGPYFGKRYIDVSGHISFHDWIEGGGTYDSYWAGRS